MVAVYCADACLAGAVVQMLPDLPVRLCTCREQFQDLLGCASCAVVVLPDLRDCALGSWLRSLLRREPHAGWILVTRPSPDNVSVLLHLRGEPNLELVWLGEWERTLAPAVLRVLQTDDVAFLARMIACEEGLPPELSGGLARACEAEPVPRTVKGMSRAAELAESRLRYLWRQCMEPGPSPLELVEWLILARAFRLKPSLGSWDRVAKRLGLKEDTLRAVCRRRTGLTPGELGAEGAGAVRARMARWWAGARAA